MALSAKRLEPTPLHAVGIGPTVDATSILSIHVFLLFCIPASLIFAPLGAPGTPAGILAVGCLAWWAVCSVGPELTRFHGLQPIRSAMYVFAAVVLISYVGAAADPPAAVELRAADRGLIALLAWCGVTLAAADGLVNLERLTKLMRATVLGGAFVAALGIVQFATGFDIASYIRVPGLTPNAELAFIGARSTFRRVAGTTNHPIEFGVVLALVLPLAMHFAFADANRRKARDVIAVALIATAIPMSVSRSAVLGLGVGWAVVVFAWPRRQQLTALALVPVFLVAMRLVVPGLLGTIKSLFVNLFTDPSVTGRTDDYAVLGDFVAHNPWFGRGLYTFLPERYITLDNQYLLQLVETGVFGLAALVGLLLTGVCCARGARRRFEDDWSRSLAQAVAASIAASMVTFVTFDALAFPMATGVTFLMLGISGALWRMARSSAGW